MYLYIFLTSEDRKNNKYFQAYKQVVVEFKPLAMEMHGLTSDTFKMFLKKLATEVSEANDMPYCISLSYWQKRVSTTLQKT
jgi:hypothetical protein